MCGMPHGAGFLRASMGPAGTKREGRQGAGGWRVSQKSLSNGPHRGGFVCVNRCAQNHLQNLLMRRVGVDRFVEKGCAFDKQFFSKRTLDLPSEKAAEGDGA